jgi:hypothetical protein
MVLREKEVSFNFVPIGRIVELEQWACVILFWSVTTFDVFAMFARGG